MRKHVILILLMVGSVPAVGASGSWAQTTSPESTVSFQSGQVTAKQGSILQINNQNYTLAPEAIIKDDEGKPRGEKDLTPGTEVRFHVKRGDIDQIVVVLPR